MVSRTLTIGRYLPVLVAMLALASCSKEATTFNEVASGMRFETTESLFIYDAGREELILVKPGTSSEVPVSAENFREYPGNWMFTEEYKERFGELHMYPRASKVWLLVPGTILTITKVEKRTNYVEGPWVAIRAIVDDPQLSATPVTVSVNRLFNDTAGKNANPTPSTALKRIS